MPRYGLKPKPKEQLEEHDLQLQPEEQLEEHDLQLQPEEQLEEHDLQLQEPHQQPPPPAARGDEMLLSWIATLTPEEVEKIFKPEGLRELLQRLAKEGNPVAKIALAI
ncbi:MAG: hypothetical protein ABWU84_12755 [Pyrobaculum sp.]|uniref:hypothetical protein n=1 Tax=Pyrobaculum sp. TaxID=2004705 RepID=UPI003EEC6F1F